MNDTHVHLIAPSGYPHDRAAMARGVARLREAGCVVDGLEVLERSELRYAGSDAQRADDLNALAVRESLPDIVLAIRGGYGATRLLEHLHYDALRERFTHAHTALVGHSDFTALQLALHAKSGLITFGGPMLGPDFGAEVVSEFTARHFWSAVRAPQAQLAWASRDERELDVEGPLWGGNLAMLCSLLGTPYFPRIDDGILFVEDVGEPPYRIERLLYQLHLSGVLGRQRALLLGDFSRCRPGSYDNGYGLAEAIGQIRRVTNVPVIDGLPFGHEPDKFTLPFGAPARLQMSGHGVQLGVSGYPHITAWVDPRAPDLPR